MLERILHQDVKLSCPSKLRLPKEAVFYVGILTTSAVGKKKGGYRNINRAIGLLETHLAGEIRLIGMEIHQLGLKTSIKKQMCDAGPKDRLKGNIRGTVRSRLSLYYLRVS